MRYHYTTKEDDFRILHFKDVNIDEEIHDCHVKILVKEDESFTIVYIQPTKIEDAGIPIYLDDLEKDNPDILELFTEKIKELRNYWLDPEF